tara:strand:- start:35 stop:208 length:174 start_codon:yes stop_codon:yes gene_type:complete
MQIVSETIFCNLDQSLCTKNCKQVDVYIGDVQVRGTVEVDLPSIAMDTELELCMSSN